MAGPPITPPNPIPAINKEYTDIRFFIKNSETKKAFVDTSFTGTANGYLQDDGVTKIIYPNENFDNSIGDAPYIDLPYLSDAYELKIPEFLDNGGVGEDGFTVTGLSDCFANVPIDTYLLYRITDSNIDLNGLKVLGYIQSKTSDSEVVLSSLAPEETQGESLELFSWTGELNAEDLSVLNFKFQDSFYMVVRNADYTTGNHDAVLQIDTSKTSANYTTYPQPFAYSPDKILNPNYFTLQRISKSKDPLTPEMSVVNIPCSIKGVSKWSEKELIDNTLSINSNNVPFWSVYEINPNSVPNQHLDKKTFYRLTINATDPGGLPSTRVYKPSAPPEG